MEKSYIVFLLGICSMFKEEFHGCNMTPECCMHQGSTAILQQSHGDEHTVHIHL